MDDEKKGNPSIPVRVGVLEVDVSAMKTDIKWIKLMVAPLLLISFVSLLILVATSLGP